jgi:hypothetical protein
MQLPIEFFHRPLGLGLIAQHRRCDPVRLVVDPTSADGHKMIDRWEQLPKSGVRLRVLPVRMRREVVPKHNMKETENTGVNESIARVAVDEAITCEQVHRLLYREPADDFLYRHEWIAPPKGLSGRTSVPDTKSSAYIGQHPCICIHSHTFRLLDLAHCRAGSAERQAGWTDHRERNAAHLQIGTDELTRWSRFSFAFQGAHLEDANFDNAIFSGELLRFANAIFSGERTSFANAIFSDETGPPVDV